MNVIINDQLMEFDKHITITDLLILLNQKTFGTAIAVNKIVIPKNQWNCYFINDKDNILLFQVISGG
ncbi:sulfur carrier protein ThiS [Candidatus Providencia siddallii]|uniref:Sulfur carrier protein ThiS n=1 Tax=Candidatus Providencia siddallii TaxID=1715285 RepID=A0ABM9NNK8_9GAMM